MGDLRYAWRSFAFDVDDALIDQSSIVLVSPDGPHSLGFGLTVARDGLGDAGTLKGYVDVVLRELATSVSGFRLEQRDDQQTLGGQPAIVLVHHATTPEGQAVTQRQTFGLEPDGVGVVVVTATALAAHEPQARAAHQRLCASWRTLSS
jgi:hypothetical protein